jgi:hypothetical protein
MDLNAARSVGRQAFTLRELALRRRRDLPKFRMSNTIQ